MFQSIGGVYVSTFLLGQKWLSHGFGSRVAGDWPGEYTRVKQIHSDLILRAEELGPDSHGDAITVCEAGRWAGIRTADCVPLLIADPVNKCAAAVHAGWRGTVADIAGKTVLNLEKISGTRSEDLIAAVGPCIGQCCYEVGPEVSDLFRDLFPESVALRHIDIAEANRRQLIAAGIPPENIDVASLCTSCDTVQFHSFRRDRELSGRMVSAVRINETAS